MSKQPVNLTLQACLELFIDRCERENLSSATIQFYLYNIGSFIRYLLDEHNSENPPVVEFKADNIHKYLKRVKERCKWEGHPNIKVHKGKVGGQSVRTYTRALRTFGNWLFSEGLIEENILKLVKLPKAANADKEVLTDAEIDTVMDSFNIRTELGLRNAIIFTLAYDCGIRMGGIANLLVKDVDLRLKTVRIRLKGGDITVLPIGDLLTRQIREYIIKYRGLGKDEEPLIVNVRGGKLTENAIKKMFSKLKGTTGIKRIHCHLGRHTFATNYVMEGHSQHELQLALAHQSDTASKKYIHLAERVTHARRGADSHFDKMQELDKDLKRTIAKVR